MAFPGARSPADNPKSVPNLLRAMALPAVGLSPGWATGAVHLVDDPLRWSSGRTERAEVLALPALWWPAPHELPAGVRAVLLQGLPTDRRPSGTIPVVGGIDLDVLREGETVEVNGSKGTVLIQGTEEVEVVTALLERDDGRILLLERSSQVGSFRGHWAGVSGFLEDPTPLEQVYREIQEETGIGRDELVLRTTGSPVLARDAAKIFVVHPFRFGVRTTELKLDWEHVRAEWVDPAEIRRRPTVPKLDRVWEAVRPTGVPKA
jgi:8-oxo-dGTP diphosphatase